VVLRLRPEPQGAPLLRSYSLSDAPGTDHYRISVKEEECGAASRYLLRSAHVGGLLEVSAPRGAFTLDPGDRPVVLLSAGVGITPLLAMLHTLAAGATARQVWWLHGARSGAEHPFARETAQLLQSIARSRTYVAYSRASASEFPGEHFDGRGRLDLEVLRKLGVPRDSDFYLCGPPSFLADLARGLSDWGVPADRVHSENFGPTSGHTPGISETTRQPHAPPGPAGEGARVSFARSGLSVRWSSRFQSLLNLAEACDVPVRWSCRTGVCHSCEVGLISGGVTYEPDPLELPANGNLLICCSKPLEDVVIDL